ncbi:RelE family toxin-antitoxin system [Klebsiella pneumoniae]|nr:RelE family toxin-antitoxin system [Klebsiella pneumoniae]
MTTNITELALRLKLEAHRAVSNFNPQMNIKTRDLKELVETLEKAQQRIDELESRTVKLPDLRQIVSGDRYVWSDGVYNYSQDVKVALADAGIKVGAE